MTYQTMLSQGDVVFYVPRRAEARCLGIRHGTKIQAEVIQVCLNPNRRPGLGRVSYRLGVLVGGNIVGTTIAEHKHL